MRVTTHSDTQRVPASRVRYRRIALVAVVLVVLNCGGGVLAAQLNLQVWPRHNDMIEMIMLAIFVTYVLAMMMPFVPGIEIGMAIMLVLGPGGIVLVYLCTQIALALSFLVGRLVPVRSMQSMLRQIHLERASHTLEELDRTDPYQRIKSIAERAPYRWIGALLRNRYLALAIALNLPGNAVIGGAGGIGAVAGMSCVFRFSRFMLVVAMATAPVPVFLLMSGISW